MLQIEPSNRKALYRRGQAYMGNADYHRAIKDLRAAVKLAPADECPLIQEKLNLAQEKAGSRIDDVEDEDADVEEIDADGTGPALPRDQPTRIEELGCAPC